MQPSTTDAAATFPWYINRRFATFWTGGILSGFGDSIFEWTLALWAATVLGPEGAWVVVAILVASTGPGLIAGPLTGVLVDRWTSKVRVVVLAAVLSAILTLAAALILADSGPPLSVSVQIALVLGVVVAASVIAQFFQPASGIIIRDLVPVAARERSAALYQVSRSATTLIAPALAAPLFAAFGIGWALVINGVSFLVGVVFYRLATQGWSEPALSSAGLVTSSRLLTESNGTNPTGRRSSRWAEVSVLLRVLRDDLWAGIHFVRTSPTLSTLILALAAGFGGFGIWVALDVFFFRETLNGSTAAYGLLGTAQGAGELIGAAVMVRLIDRLGPGRLLWLGLALIGVVMVGYGLIRSVPVAIATCFVLGLGTPSINVVIGPMIMRVTPRDLLGRVTGTVNPIVSGALLAGAAIGGSLYTLTGSQIVLGELGRVDALRALIILGGISVLLAALVVGLRLGRVDAREEQRRAAGVDCPDGPG